MGTWPGRSQCSTYGVLGWQIHCVCVEVLEKGTVHRVRKLVYLYHLLHVLIPIGLEHGSEVLTPTTNANNRYYRYPFPSELAQAEVIHY